MRRPPLLLAALVAAAPLAAPRAEVRVRSLAAPHRVALRIPMDHSTGHIWVEVTIDGQGPFRFNVDTGFGISLSIDPELARELGLRRPRAGAAPLSGGRLDLETLQVGELSLHDVEAQIIDFSWLRDREGKADRVLGVLGYPLFADYLFTIDYPAETLWVAPGRLPEEISSHTLPFDERYGRPFIMLRLGSLEVSALLDTGSQNGLLLPKRFEKRLETKPSKLRIAGVASHFGNEFALLCGNLEDRISLAGYSYEKPEVLFAEYFETILIGHAILSSYVITFDGNSKRVHFALPK